MLPALFVALAASVALADDNFAPLVLGEGPPHTWLRPLPLRAASPEVFIPASDPRLTYVGRTLVNADGSRVFDWEAVSILVTLHNATYLKAALAPSVPGAPGSTAARTKLITDVVGSSLAAEKNFSQGFSASELWVDSVAGAMSNNTYVVAEGLDTEEWYTLRLFNALEPLFHGGGGGPGYGPGVFTFFGVWLDGGLLPPPPAPTQRSLEWVGDSLTAGFGSRGERPPCETSQLSSSNYYSYTRYLADALEAPSSVIAWSGKGIDFNCCDKDANMSTLYLQTLGNDPSRAWDFAAAPPPSALALNLGTNDMSQYNGTAAFLRALADAFEAFILRATRDLYKAPALPVLLVQGPANNTLLGGVLQTVHDELRAQGVNVHRLSAILSTPREGCSGHPGTESHKAMAALLEPQVREVLGWQKVGGLSHT